MHTIQNAIDGSKFTSSSRRMAPVYNPATGEQTANLPLSTVDEVNEAVAAAKKAAAGWATTPPLKRIAHMFRFKELLDRHAEEIARTISKEHGKTHADARGELARGIDVVDFACGIPHLLKGEYSRNVGPEIELLVRPPAARRGRRHNAVQLPGHGADVDVSCCNRLRKHLRAEAVRARSLHLDADLGSVPGGGLPARRAQCRARRQGSGRCDPRPSRHQGG